MLRYLTEFATPLHTAVHWVPFQWSTVKEEDYRSLKVILSYAPVVQPPNCSQPFHVLVDASDMAIENGLMQRTPPSWYRTFYYAGPRFSISEKNYSTTERDAPT